MIQHYEKYLVYTLTIYKEKNACVNIYKNTFDKLQQQHHKPKTSNHNAERQMAKAIIIEIRK